MGQQGDEWELVPELHFADVPWELMPELHSEDVPFLPQAKVPHILHQKGGKGRHKYEHDGHRTINNVAIPGTEHVNQFMSLPKILIFNQEITTNFKEIIL